MDCRHDCVIVNKQSGIEKLYFMLGRLVNEGMCAGEKRSVVCVCARVFSKRRREGFINHSFFFYVFATFYDFFCAAHLNVLNCGTHLCSHLLLFNRLLPIYYGYASSFFEYLHS